MSSWSCTAGCAGPAAPLHAAAPPPEAPHAAEALPHDAPAATSPGASRPAAAFWLTRGPPLGVVADSTNSWLYVPLLHAAAADLAPTALEAWRADPRATDWWEQARQLLAASAPVAPQTLIAALARTAETAPAHAHHVPDIVARIHEAGLPNGSLVHAGWAVRQLREPDGYLLAPVQEVLLECFGGHALAAALDRHSDRFRPDPEPLSAAPPVEELPGQPPALPQLPGQAPLYRLPPPCIPIMLIPRSATSTQMRQSWHQRRRTLGDEDTLLAAAATRVRASTARGGGGRGRRGRGRGRHTATAVPAPPAAAAPETRPEVTPQQALFNPASTRRQRASAAAEAGMRLGLAALDAIDLQSTCRQRVLISIRCSRPHRASGVHSAPHCVPACDSLCTLRATRTQ